MIREARVLFCDNEHGNGEVTFPNLKEMRDDDIERQFIDGKPRVAELRKDAKQAGWGRVNGGDYCPDCMAGGI